MCGQETLQSCGDSLTIGMRMSCCCDFRPDREPLMDGPRCEPLRSVCDRLPLWECAGVEALLNAGMRSALSAFHECTAVQLTAAEESWLQSASGRHMNRYTVRVGHPRFLAEAWQDFFIEVGRLYRFSGEDDWGRQRPGFESLFRGFFGSTAVRSQVGWVSLISMQRPHHLRSWEDAQIETQRESVRLGGSLPVRAEWRGAGWHAQPGDAFCYQWAWRSRRPSLRYSELSRRLRAPAYWPRTERWIEWRYVPAIEGEHDALLQAGKIPSIVTDGTQLAATVGTTGYLNLVMIALPQQGHPLFLNNTLEIAADTGRILSIRAFEAPLVTGLLAASSIERRTLAELVEWREGI